MKLTANKSIEVLHMLGLKDAELVDDDTQVDFNEDAVLLAVDEARSPIIKQKLEADLRKTVEATIAGKQGDKLRRALRDKFNIPLADLKDLDDEAAIAKAVDQYAATLQQDTAGLRAEITKQAQEKADAINALTAQKDSEVAAWKSKYADRHVLDYVAQSLADAPLSPNADKAAIARLVKQNLENSGIAFEYDEVANAVIVLDKATKAPKLNSAGTASYSLKEGAEAVLKPLGVWEKDTRNMPPVGPTNRNGQDYTPANPNQGGTDPKTDPARAKAEQMAAMMGGQ